MGWDKKKAREHIAALEGLYKSKLKEEWQTQGRTPPEWYDHNMDLYLWPSLGNGFWVERGALSVQCMRDGDRVLDVACGDGFYDKTFYSSVVDQVDAFDIDPEAIAHAKEFNAVGNVSYQVQDAHGHLMVLAHIKDAYDVVVMNAAIEHFEFPQIQEILKHIGAVLKPGGVFTGCTIEGKRGVKRHPGHGHEFETLQEMAKILREVFPHVGVHSTNYGGGRVNYYWQASDRDSDRFGIFKVV